MKKLLLLLVSLYIITPAFAQDYVPFTIGFGGSNLQKVIAGTDTMKMSYSGGQTFVTTHTPFADGKFFKAGFRFNHKIFNNTFSKDLFTSKGYYADVVVLKWDIKNYSEQIKRFYVWRKQLDSTTDSVLVATVSADEREWKDEYAESGVLYQYTLYASGISNDFIEKFLNYVDGVGFRFPSGQVSGRVTYKGGTAVEGVNVYAQTEDNLSGKSIYLDGSGTYIGYSPTLKDPYFMFDTAFCFQAWFKPDGNGSSTLFAKGSQYSITHQPGRVIFNGGGTSVSVDFAQKSDTFFHVAAMYTGDSIKLFVLYNNETYWKAAAKIISNPVSNDSTVYFGASSTGNNFKGYIDEIRLWHKSFSDKDLLNQSGLYISGTESGLTGYYRCNEGVGENVFDLSRQGFAFNEHHTYVHNGQWTSVIPLLSQLAYKGITDKNGNYIIAGIPFATAGSTYQITPVFGIHKFDPTEALLFLGSESSVHNSINFTDASSFPVSGNVRYRNTNFPVYGAMLYVDGKAAIASNSTAVTTDANGNFTVDVPIGQHFISVNMYGHGFEHNGRYPAPEPGNAETLKDIQGSISGLKFIDTTLIKVIGRVVGGPVQGSKKLGMGKSINNIGNATIVFSTQKQFDLSEAVSDTSNTWNNAYYQGASLKQKGSTAWSIEKLTPKIITIKPDATTGEFVAWLLPEKYTVQNITAGSYTFGDEFKTLVDLSSAYIWQKETDTSEIQGGTRTDSVSFQAKQSFVYRERPTVTVTAKDGTNVFWDKTIKIWNKSINLNDADGNPLTGYPVFTQRKSYNLQINIFEKYINSDTQVEDLVAVTDGNVLIQNNLAIDDAIGTHDIIKGKVIYDFVAGLPNTTESMSGDDSYTKSMTILVLTGKNGSISTYWPSESAPFKGYVFGGMPTGNNFVTTGPNQIDMILRDPPGSNSYSYLSKGTTFTTTKSYKVKIAQSGAESVTFQLGAEVKIFAGIGVGTITETEYGNDLKIGIEHEKNWNHDTSSTTTVTTTEQWQTSDASDFVGADGDLFVGTATNIVYGKSIFVALLPDTNCSTCTGKNLDGYKIGIKTGLRLNPTFGTTFIYSQYHIENNLIPNLIEIRNLFFKNSSNIYTSKLTEDNPNYGNANTKTTVSADKRITDGDSYKFTIPSNIPEGGAFIDSVEFFNQQIAGWKKALKRNESEKLEAVLESNYSFDGGVKYEKSVSNDYTHSDVDSWDFMVTGSLSDEFGFTFNKFGLKVSLEEKVGGGGESTTQHDTTRSTTFGYSFYDENVGDYLSVDVKKPKSNTGPVFATRGGQTSCPYEGAIKTKYEKPGKIISEATMQREKPTIEVEVAIMSDVPEDQTANFTLLFRNMSETSEDSWFSVTVDETTNPDGANVMIDGSAVGNYRLVNVPAGQTVKKILSLSKTLDDVYSYENISIIVQSLCDGNIADTTVVTAYFKPVCSAVTLASPGNPWTINTITGTTQPIGIEGYNLQHSTFEKLLFQYKPSSSSQWVTDNTLYVTQADYDAAQNPKSYINSQSSMDYSWDLSSLPDRQYDIRLKSVCSDNTENESEIHTGIKDIKPPKVFGTPQPGDGILSPNDDILLTFDEPIEAGLLTPYNFSVKAVTNGTKTDHNACLYFDGVNAYANVLKGISFANKSFTIEFWAKRGTVGEQVIFAQSSDVEIGFDATNRLYAKLAGTIVTTIDPIVDITNWQHFAVSYNKESKSVDIFLNDQIVTESVAIPGAIKGEGKMLVGKSTSDNRFFNGYLHEFRIWEKALSFTKVYSNLYTKFNGGEVGLAGYWPMNEADGTKAEDLARHRHATLYNATWRVFPSGKGREFNGSSDYVDISTSSTVVITSQMDYTLEFWFKAPKQTNTVLFSNGKANGTDNEPRADDGLLVGINGSGEIYALNRNIPLVAAGENFTDNAWHHLAIVMNRAGNVSLYIDAMQKATKLGSDWGGFAGANMCIGARRYKEGGIQHDNFFTGNIDEFRIWKLARELKQLKLDKNNHLTGKEIGLCAYYPFEYYYYNMGVPEIRETLDDKYIPQYLGYPTGGTALANGGTFSEDVPNIKDARPLQDLTFDWVVNTDRIIIATNEPNELIENTTVELTVQNVEDKNENRLVSPVTWTAFINKNQVLWDATELELEKKVYDPYTFTVDILNLGGKPQNFSLENLPPWLSASEKSGTLQADSKLTITFTVDEAINIGRYQEAVFLHSDFGYDEKLLLNLNVFETAPNWIVDESKYQYSMSVIAQLKIDDEISTDANDIIGAFINNECRGVAHPEYMESFDKYIAFIDIYSNKVTGDSVKFKVWDASEGLIRDKVTPGYSFISNDVKGTPGTPQILTANGGYSLQIPLAKGWNWVSFNLNSADLASAKTAFTSSRRNSGDQVKGPVDTTGMIIFDNYTTAWSNNFAFKKGFRPGFMYMVKTTNADTVGISGNKIATESTPVTIKKGWNWLGYTPLTGMTVNDAFAYFAPSDGDLLKSKHSFSMYTASIGWLGSLEYLKPGEGYMLWSGKYSQLYYPEKGLFQSKSAIDNSEKTYPEEWIVQSDLYSSNMSVIAKVFLDKNKVADENYILGAFNSDQCIGVASPQYNTANKNLCWFLTVNGDVQNTPVQFKVLNTKTLDVLDVTQTTDFIQDKILGSVTQPLELSVYEEQELGQSITKVECEVLPNPFTNLLKATVKSTGTGKLTIQFFNVSGIIISSQEKILLNGKNNFEWDDVFCSKFPSGVYYIKFVTDNQTEVLKIIKK